MFLPTYSPINDDLPFALSMHSSLSDPQPSPAALELHRLAFAHMENAVRLAARPIDLASHSDAVFVVDGLGRVSAMSQAAETLLITADGLTLYNRQLKAALREDRPRLDKAIRNALRAISEGGCGGSVKLARASGKRDLIALVKPHVAVGGPFVSISPAAYVRVIDPEAVTPRAAIDQWADLFGISNAERRLVAILSSRDLNLREAAELLGIAYATARVQLASVFDKAGVGSQAQLIRLITRIAGRMHCCRFVGHQDEVFF